MPESELHTYIQSVLETGDHGPCRVIEFDINTLNDAIERHAEGIGEILSIPDIGSAIAHQHIRNVLLSLCSQMYSRVSGHTGNHPDFAATRASHRPQLSWKHTVSMHRREA
jgi:hypothetical protein